MIDWTKPIETVPDERNPKPVPCRVKDLNLGHNVLVTILADWFDRDGDNCGDDHWYYNFDGTTNDWLPKLRNVEAA